MSKSVKYKDAIRIQVKKFEGTSDPECVKFCIDPEITSFEMLQNLLCKAYDYEGFFHIFYENFPSTTYQNHFKSILNESDLKLAFQKSLKNSLSDGSEPCLSLILKTNNDYSNASLLSKFREITPTKLLATNSLVNKLEQTLSKVQKAFATPDENTFVENPVTYLEYKKFLSSDGQMTNFEALRKHIFYRGIEPSLRKQLWKHLLNVYPENLSEGERLNYICRKSNEYYELRDFWRAASKNNKSNAHLNNLMKMIEKDVQRTDRYHEFYSGSDNINLESLSNILTTYSLNHPQISYCQGMNDYASALLVAMENEAVAYICFCALMRRIRTNFTTDGIAMTKKFADLIDALKFYDLEFYNYLHQNQADGLLFCYRWILLEMKREFAFSDSLLMFEVLWSSLPFKRNITELCLFEKKFSIPSSLIDTNNANNNKTDADIQKTIKASLSHSNFLLSKKKQEMLTQMCLKDTQSLQATSNKKLIKNLNEFNDLRKQPVSTTEESVIDVVSPAPELHFKKNQFTQNQILNNSIDENKEASSLPPPSKFGDGNPFLMFLCLTMLLQNKQTILQQNMDHNEIAMFFDKLIRRNDVHKVLNQARLMFVEYLEQFQMY